MVFQNSSQNRKAIKGERDSCFHSKSKIKYLTLISRFSFRNKFEQNSKNEKMYISETRVTIVKQSKLSETSRSHTKLKNPTLNSI